MLRSIIAASVIVLSAGTASAQDYPRLSGSGDNAVVEYGPRAPGSVVGGGAVRMTGTGDNTRFVYERVEAVPGRVARLTGSRDDAEVTYAPDTASAGRLARGRAAEIGG